ncbi:MAG: hydrogenase maturation nickel metallochaperone HypA [Ancalomicrobiaceae bacterium]|nr:hydrogenase maturation nickel metallochaperone HypA [Ancalomicrobiaceae bacterium]
MHEMSLCQGIIGIVEDAAEQQSFARVKSVTLELGRLGHVLPEAMLFCFDAVSRGTLADGAELVIRRTEGGAWCFDCEASVPLDDRLSPCPKCGGGRLQVTSGEELRVLDIEVE